MSYSKYYIILSLLMRHVQSTIDKLSIEIKGYFTYAFWMNADNFY